MTETPVDNVTQLPPKVAIPTFVFEDARFWISLLLAFIYLCGVIVGLLLSRLIA